MQERTELGRCEDLTGKRFTRLTVLRFSGRSKHGKAMWECLCDCGKTVIVCANPLKDGRTKSCGCLHHDTKIRLTHGESKTRLFRIWCAIHGRCNDKKNPHYGGKGISVFDGWNTFIQFRDWANNNGYKDNLTIDRIDPSLGYYPENCRWITKSENMARANRSRKKRREIQA